MDGWRQTVIVVGSAGMITSVGVVRFGSWAILVFPVLALGAALVVRARALGRVRHAPEVGPPVDLGEAHMDPAAGPVVAALADHGYRHELTFDLSDGSRGTILGGPGGSMAAVFRGPLGPTVQITSCLVPRRRWLRTAVAAGSRIGDRFLVDGRPRGSSPAQLATAHREALDEMARHGVRSVPVGPDHVVDDLVARREALRDEPQALAPMPGPLGANPPLARLRRFPAAMAEIRAEQAAMAGR